MGQPQISFDTEVFARTTSLFAAKRHVLAVGSVETLATEIVRRLAQARFRGTMLEAPVIPETRIVAFCEALVQSDPGAALRFIEDRRAEGLTRQGVYLGYISAAAQRLGEDWDAGRVSVLQVTNGTGHLYALMRALRAEGPAVRAAFDAQRCALFATVPGEDHGIGITIAADMFREVGWEIDLQTGTEHESLVEHVEQTKPHIIGLSFSTGQRLGALVRLVVALRVVLPHAIICVSPGSDLNAQTLHALVDVDLVFPDTQTAHRELDRLIRLRG